MSSCGRGRALGLGLGPHHPQDLLQCHNAWAEGVARLSWMIWGSSRINTSVCTSFRSRFGLCLEYRKSTLGRLGGPYVHERPLWAARRGRGVVSLHCSLAPVDRSWAIGSPG